MTTWTCIRCGETREEEFSIHKPRDSDVRSCSGTVVPSDQVEETRDREYREFAASMRELGRRESGWR